MKGKTMNTKAAKTTKVSATKTKTKSAAAAVDEAVVKAPVKASRKKPTAQVAVKAPRARKGLSLAQSLVLGEMLPRKSFAAVELQGCLGIPMGPLTRCLNVLLRKDLIKYVRTREPVTYTRTALGTKALGS